MLLWQSLPCAMMAVVFMLVFGVVFLFPETPHAGPGDMNYTVAVLGGVLGGSLVWYYMPKWGGVHWFTGPVRTIEADWSGDVKGEAQVSVLAVA